MSRRTHKKSRNGCVECKRRHIRCDQNQPICANCGSAERRCSFDERDAPRIVANHHHGHYQVIAPNPASTTSSTPRPMTISGNTLDTEEPLDTYSVNMVHLKLFNNLSSESFLHMDESGQTDIETSIYIKYALTTPYLMHQLLAGSALQLSTTSTTRESCDLYRQHATGLHTRALALFNESNPVLEVHAGNCVHIFLFASLVGVHLLCETLHYQRDSLEGFVDRFTHCLGVYRGVQAVIEQSRELLDETELGPRLELSRVVMYSDVAKGSECDALRDLVIAKHMISSSRKVYEDSVTRLQRVFDVQRATLRNKTSIPIIFAWPILLSPCYLELLRQRQAEALVILAYYAVLLHRGRDSWLIGNGGRFLIETIVDRLGPCWGKWLEFPSVALREDLIA